MENIELEEIIIDGVRDGSAMGKEAEIVGQPIELQDQDNNDQNQPSTSSQNSQDVVEGIAAQNNENENQPTSSSSSTTSDNAKAVPIEVTAIKQDRVGIADDPAPRGTECVLYLPRNIYLFAPKSSNESMSFYGELRGEEELLLLNFNLKRRSGADYFDLRISDVTRPFESHLSLARFQQAELLLQFVNPDQSGNRIIHEEPAFQVSLDLPNYKWKMKEGWRDFLHHHKRSFSVLCSNVFPADKLDEIVQKREDQLLIIMRVYFKLVQGELDVLHGIQKCFHPDKSLYDLRDVMGKALENAENTDMILVSGDNVGYRVHRAILAANSPVFKTMFNSGLKESTSEKVSTPPFVTAAVLEAFLKYVYARNRMDLENDPLVTMLVLTFAHQYEMNLLVAVCEESLLAMPIELFSQESCFQIFRFADLLDRAAIETKIVHILMRMDVKLSSSTTYIKFIRTAPGAAAKMTEMIMQFQNAGPSTSKKGK